MPFLTRSFSRSRVLILLALAAAPCTASAQRGFDVQVHGLGVVGADAFVGAGGGAGLLLGRTTRLALTATGGWLEPGQGAGRVEGLVSYHLAPPASRRPAPYAGAGVAVLATEAQLREYLVVVVGLERRATAGVGWFAEVGAGGGVRVALGVRLTRLPARRRRRAGAEKRKRTPRGVPRFCRLTPTVSCSRRPSRSAG